MALSDSIKKEVNTHLRKAKKKYIYFRKMTHRAATRNVCFFAVDASRFGEKKSINSMECVCTVPMCAFLFILVKLKLKFQIPSSSQFFMTMYQFSNNIKSHNT